MTRRGRLRKARNFGVGNARRVLDVVYQPTKATTENDCHGRLMNANLVNRFTRRINLVRERLLAQQRPSTGTLGGKLRHGLIRHGINTFETVIDQQEARRLSTAAIGGDQEFR